MATEKIHLTLPYSLLQKIDEAADEEFATRSEFIRRAITDRLQYVDECRAKLAGLAANPAIPTDEELLDLLRLKGRWRWAARLRQQTNHQIIQEREL